VQNINPSPLIELPATAQLPSPLPKLTSERRADLEKQLAELTNARDALAGDETAMVKGLQTPARSAMLRFKLASYRRDGSPRTYAMGVRERFEPIDSLLYSRGELDQPGELVRRGLVQVVGPESAAPIATGSGRRELANWLASPENLLPARVMVNRIWLHLFGRGLIPTPDNFGAAGRPPSHPELLDALAISFVRQGWSVKRIFRQIVLRRVYQLGSTHDEHNFVIDPDNVLVWRMSKKRLEADAIRDAVLASSGKLPGFIAIKPVARNGGAQDYGSAFLPAIYHGTRIGNEVTPVANAQLGNIQNPRLDPARQRLQLPLIQSMNRTLLARETAHPGVEGIIESYELAFLMQGSVPEVMDLAKESDATRKLYGIDDDETADFCRQCLLARRFVEAGARFVELSHGDWDQHRNLKADHARHALAVDKPIAGLLTDLRARGLLKDTLVISGGEFGRTPHAQNGAGRDHNNKGYCLWMAGGGVKPGLSYGQTDDHDYEAVAHPVHVHDWHATILHLLGLDHEKLTYRYVGREMRLTDVKERVVKDIVA
jgi:hypothetical protein